MKQTEETVATYFINGKTIDVVGWWTKDTPENEYEAFDLYDGPTCINEGEPMDGSGGQPVPSESEVAAFVKAIRA